MGYVGKGPYINTEVLAPLLTEDINLYYPNTTYHHRIRPDIYCLPFLAKQYFRQDGWPAKIENFTHAPSTQPLNPVELPIYPFSPKFRANLCSFQVSLIYLRLIILYLFTSVVRMKMGYI